MIKETINLTEVFRQKEQDFVDMLNRFRVGQVLPAGVPQDNVWNWYLLRV